MVHRHLPSGIRLRARAPVGRLNLSDASFVEGPKVQSLPATGTALEVLNERLDALLA